MIVQCFLLRAARLSSKLIGQGYARERLKVDLGISLNIMKSPSLKCYMTFLDMTIYSDTLNRSDILHQFANLLPNWTLLPILTFLSYFGGFHRILQRLRLANRERLLLQTPGPVPFRDLHLFLCWDHFHLSWSWFRTLNFEHSLVLLFCLSPSPVAPVNPYAKNFS